MLVYIKYDQYMLTFNTSFFCRILLAISHFYGYHLYIKEKEIVWCTVCSKYSVLFCETAITCSNDIEKNILKSCNHFIDNMKLLNSTFIVQPSNTIKFIAAMAPYKQINIIVCCSQLKMQPEI